MSYETRTYVKGSRTRIARKPAEAVAAEWDGFVLASSQAESADTADYRELQAQARALGLPASGSKAKLAAAIANHRPESPEAPETDSTTVTDQP